MAKSDITKAKAKIKVKAKMGHPSTYTIELAERICKAIATSSAGLGKICKAHEDFPCPDTVYEWLIVHKEFSDMYRQAREYQQEVHINAMLEIAADNSNDMMQTEKGLVFNPTAVARAKLMIDTLKWHATKLAPHKYGDRVQQEITIVRHEDVLKELE